MKLSAPRGTNDILPESIALWQGLEFSVRQILKNYAYQEIRTPMYEETALFKRSLGSTSDVVNKQLLELAATGDEGLCLRPEGTAAIVRSYIENNFDKKESLSKLFYLGPMFRGERPQKGRLRQFHQIGVEAIGPNSTSPLLDAEVIALGLHILTALGVQGPRLKINSLGSKEDKEHVSSWLRAEFTKHKAELCVDCQNRFERNVFRVLDCKNDACKKLVVKVMGEGKSLPLKDESRRYFEDVQNALKSLGIPFVIAPHLVRGLDYYTHTVFEITAEGLGSQDAVGAGGRYNGLLHELGADARVDFGAIGFALGMERILLASGKTTAEAHRIDVYVIAMDIAFQPQAFKLAQELRHNGISTDISLTSGSMKSQMGRANKANARFALILGEQEIKDGTIAVKDMQVGQQEAVPVKDIINILKAKLL